MLSVNKTLEQMGPRLLACVYHSIGEYTRRSVFRPVAGDQPVCDTEVSLTISVQDTLLFTKRDSHLLRRRELGPDEILYSEGRVDPLLSNLFDQKNIIKIRNNIWTSLEYFVGRKLAFGKTNGALTLSMDGSYSLENGSFDDFGYYNKEMDESLRDKCKRTVPCKRDYSSVRTKIGSMNYVDHNAEDDGGKDGGEVISLTGEISLVARVPMTVALRIMEGVKSDTLSDFSIGEKGRCWITSCTILEK
jgi:hypothetical protein